MGRFFPRSLAFAALLTLAACSQTDAPPLDPTTWAEGTGSVAGYVVNRRAGTDVGGTTVTVAGTELSAVTDETGFYRIFGIPAGDHTLTFTQEGYATSQVEGLRLEEEAETKYNTIQSEIFDPFLPVVPPDLKVSLENGDSVTPSGEADTFSFTVSGEVAEPDINGFYSVGTAGLGDSRGTSGYLNASVPGTLIFLTTDGSETLVELSATGFDGETSLHVVAYDANYNRTEAIRYINIEGASGTGDLTDVESLNALAVTFGDTAVFGPLSTGAGSFDRRAFMAAVRKNDFAALGHQAQALEGNRGFAPQDALDEVLTWVDLTFSYDGEVLPTAFRVYRKLETQGRFWLVGQLSPQQASLDPEDPDNTLFGFRDTTAGLHPGLATSYYVEAVNAQESTRSEAVSTTPLPAFEVDADSPEDGTINVSVSPEYAFSVGGRSNLVYLGALVLDRVHAEGGVIEWAAVVVDASDETEFTIPHNFDDTAINDTLQPFHAYDWQPIAVTSNGQLDEEGNITGETAISIAADFFNLLVPVFGQDFGVQDGPVNTFSTGDGSSEETP